MTSGSCEASGGAGLLGVLFVGLKLTHVIDWSWWLVTGPFWMPLACLVVLFTIFALIAVALAVFK